MEIEVRCHDGETFLYSLTDEELGAEIIESIRPTEFFNLPHLRIQCCKQTAVFNMQVVECIRFLTTRSVNVREQPPCKAFSAVSEAEYAQALEAAKERYEGHSCLFSPGECIETLFAVHCASGKAYFLRAQIIAGYRVEQLSELQNRLGKLTSVIPCPPGEYLAINPRNIQRIDVYPAPAEPRQQAAWQCDSRGSACEREAQLTRSA